MSKTNFTKQNKVKKKNGFKLTMILPILSLIILTGYILKSQILETRKLKIISTNKHETEVKSSTSSSSKVDQNEKLQVKKNSLEGTTYLDEDNRKIVKNVDDILVLVNKERNLSSDYVPKDLVNCDIPFPFKGDSPKKKMRKVAADALGELVEASKNENLEIVGVSGYRSYNTQTNIYNHNIKTKGEEYTKKVSAYPGQSEHQTGLAMDLAAASAAFSLEQSFGETREGKWLKENAYKYGFIIRYPKDKENITGYSYEPWHVRYVGKEVAKTIYEKNITLEQYFEIEKDK